MPRRNKNVKFIDSLKAFIVKLKKKGKYNMKRDLTFEKMSSVLVVRVFAKNEIFAVLDSTTKLIEAIFP